MDTDTSDHKKILELCLEGRFEDVKVALIAARARSLCPDLLQPTACIASRKQNYEMLGFCLDEGAVFDRYLKHALFMGFRDKTERTELLELLLIKNWGNIKHDEVAVQDWINFLSEHSVETEWLREHTCKQSARGGLEVLVLDD